MNSDAMLDLVIADRARMDRESQLYVARHKTTGMYTKRVQRWMDSARDWIDHAKPDDELIKQEMAFSQKHFGVDTWWTSDINQAETWLRYAIDLYQRLLTDVEFVEVKLDVRDIS